MQKSKKPEKIVEAECMTWLNINGFTSDVIDSKAVFSKMAGKFLNSMAPVGFSDIVSTDPIGRACYIELKAKGKRNNISIGQYDFLNKKINNYAFAVVVDSVDLLSMYYSQFCNFIKSGDHNGARNYLREVLPKSSMVQEMLADLASPLFPEDA